MTVKEVVEFLSLSERTIFTMIKSGQLPASKIGGRWRVEPAAMRQFVAKQRRDGQGATSA